MRSTGRRWRKPMAQFGSVKLEKEMSVPFARRLTQGICVGHHDRERTILCITKNGVVRSKSWTTQTLSDGLCATPWQMAAPELKLTKKVTADKGGAGLPLPRIVVGRAPEAEPRRFYVLSADIAAHGHTGSCPGCAALASHGKATKPHNDECRRESERSLREP